MRRGHRCRTGLVQSLPKPVSTAPGCHGPEIWCQAFPQQFCLFKFKLTVFSLGVTKVSSRLTNGAAMNKKISKKEIVRVSGVVSEPGKTATEILLYQTEDGRSRIEVRMVEETVWLSQKLMSDLFQKDVRTINEHIRNIFTEGELNPSSAIRKFRITAQDGKNYETLHYNLDVIIWKVAFNPGFKVKIQDASHFH